MPERLTIKKLQEELVAKKATWTIHPSLQTADFVPDHPLGAEPKNLRKATDVPILELAKILVETPNPLMVARRTELGLIAGSAVAHGPATGVPRASTVDWRSRWGWPWLVSVQDQGPCQSCWVFGAVALVDAMVRIEHAFWTKRSEGDVHRGMGAMCDTTGNPENALNWIRDHGVADLDCYPYYPNSPQNKPYTPSSDRPGRTVKVPSFVGIGNVEDQKKWIDAVGPLTACFAVYEDFFALGNTIYHHVTGALRGYHCILVVGYDDANGCWICKNQWGTGFGDHGYFRIRYGDSNIDTWEKCGLQGTNPDPWTKRRLHNGAMIESGNGATHRNFELAVMEGHALRHRYRDGSSLAWGSATLFANDVAEQPTLTATTYNRNFELVYATTGGRLHHWFFDQASGHWTDGGVFGPPNATGHVGFLQGSYNMPGNFELVTRVATGGLQHWWRLNGAPWTWTCSAAFGSNVRDAGSSMVQTRGTHNGKLELVVALNSGAMQRYQRDDDAGFVWSAKETFGANTVGAPMMIEGMFGASDENTSGNLELCVAVAGGHVEHWWCTTARAWQRSAVFGADVAGVVSLIEGSYGFDLEMVVKRTDGRYQHYWRDGGGWHAGTIL